MNRLAVVAVLVLGLLFFGQTCRLDRANRRHQATALRADSTEAANDTLKWVILDFEDSLPVLMQRIVQTEIERDSIDRQLKVESRVRAQLEVMVDSLQVTAAAPVTVDSTDSTDTRSASFRVRQEPFTALALVELPPPPADGRIDLTIRVDPLPLNARVVCGPRKDGIRRANVVFEVPEWASLRVERVSQDPAVCNAPAGLPAPRSSSTYTLLFAALSFIAGGLVF
jgi:hypothetical protein